MTSSIHNTPGPIRFATIAALIFMLAAAVLHAHKSSMRFDHITAEQGLSDNQVTAICQDRLGFMWFGTRDGLNRFDGYHFTIFRHDAEDSTSISDGSVSCLFEDRTGTLWAGTHSGGLNRFDREKQRFIQYRHDPRNPLSFPRGRVESICEDNNGDLWVAISGTGACLVRFGRLRKHFVRYHHNPLDSRSLSSSNVSAVCRDISGTIWIATLDSGLNRYDQATGKFLNHHYRASYSFDSMGTIQALYAAPDGNLWIRSNHRQMLVLREPWNSTSTIPRGLIDLRRLSADYLNTVYLDRTGRLWLGTLLSGVFLSESEWSGLRRATHNPADKHSLGSNRIFCIYEDRAGNIWIGTDEGISRLNKSNWNFNYYHHDPLDHNSISNSEVRCIVRDRKGQLWTATGSDGINRITTTPDRVIRYPHNPRNPTSLSENTANEIYEDKKGRLWIGTNHGLNLYKPDIDGFTHYHHDSTIPTTLPLAGIWEILEDRFGNFWVGTRGGGLGLLDQRTGHFRHYVHDARNRWSLSHNIVLCMYEDRTGNLWIGTDGGLNRFDQRTGRFTHYLHDVRNSQSLSNDRVWYIHEDRQGIFWIATSGGGLNRFDPRTGRSTAFTEKDGLASNMVCAILQDDRGRLWISTIKGISRFDPVTGRFRNYTARDGLVISEFHFKACHKDPDGFMYFGGANGFISFHPDSIAEQKTSPPMMLTSFRVFDAEYPLDTCISLKRVVRLPHDSSFFSVGFAALDFTNPVGNRYRYRLEEFDGAWRETNGTHPRADYTSIPPGTYTFHVISDDGQGTWNATGTSLVIIIEPAFWETWWFRGISAMTFASMIFAAGFIRIRNIRREGELKRRLVDYKLQALRAQMNPHFIFNSLNSILHFIVYHDTKAAHNYLSKFSRLIRMTLEHSKSEFISLADEIAALRFYIELEVIRFDNKFTYHIDIEKGIDLEAVRIPPMLIQPHVENAIKHGLLHRGNGGTLGIDIRTSASWIICLIVDNGIGRSRASEIQSGKGSLHRSRGTEIARERLEVLTSLSGKLYTFETHDLYNQHGISSGTCVEIRIPRDTTHNERHNV